LPNNCLTLATLLAYQVLQLFRATLHNYCSDLHRAYLFYIIRNYHVM